MQPAEQVDTSIQQTPSVITTWHLHKQWSNSHGVHQNQNVMASAAEAEIGALFSNGQHGTVLRTTLLELDHIQPPTPIKTDNLLHQEFQCNFEAMLVMRHG